MSGEEEVMGNEASDALIALRRAYDADVKRPYWSEAFTRAYDTLDRLLARATLPRAAMPVVHMSDCAIHNEPAYPNGPCDCGATLPAAPPRPVTPGEERGVDREAVEAAAMAEYVAASLAWWLDDSDEAGNFDGPSWQRYWNAYYRLPVEVRQGK